MRQALKEMLSKTKLYPLAKEVYRRTINRRYIRSRKQLMNFYAPLVNRAAVVFDVGANRGDFADAFLRLGSTVYAVEPHPVCIEELRALYGSDPRFTVLACALGGAPGEAKLFLGEQGMDNVSTLSEDYVRGARDIPGLAVAGWNESIMVPVETLDHLIAQFGIPDFCKIDVEGYEVEVLRGLHAPLPLVQFEYQPWSVEKAVECIDCLDALGDCRYNITMADSRDDEVALQPEWMDSRQLTALLRGRVAQTHRVGDIFASSRT
jgi:FkbM family methyltransferase